MDRDIYDYGGKGWGTDSDDLSGDPTYVNPGESEYRKHRPAYRASVVKQVWENAKGPDGKVRDPHTGREIVWQPGQPRTGVWDMGHRPGHEYSTEVDRLERGEITEEQFLDWYNDPNNYWPELPSENRSHKHEIRRGKI